MLALSLKDRSVRSVAELLEEGSRLHDAGRLDEAWEIYDAVLAIDSDHADCLHRLGVICHQIGRPDLAVPYLRRAIKAAPIAASPLNSFGNALRDLKRSDEAIEQFRLALRLRPDSPQIHGNLGSAFHDINDRPGAVAAYRNALALDPGCAELWYNLAAPLSSIEGPGMAAQLYRRALQLRPAFADASFNLGNMLIGLLRLEEAAAAFQASLRVRAEQPACHNNLGVVLQELARLDEAEACYGAALCLDPTGSETYFNLGCVFLARNRLDEATACYERTLTLRPDHAKARLALCMGQLPILYADASELDSRRRAYEHRLRQLASTAANDSAGTGLADVIGSSQPFFLPYQGEDDLELQTLYGSLACRLLAERHPPAVLPASPAPGQKVRIGIVSGYFHEHTVWQLFIAGWLKHFDRTRFEIFGYHTGLKHDDRTDTAALSCARFVEGHRTGNEWRATILADAPHALLYPEVGMDPMAGHLAAQRLAPVQCVSWGHPNTTGMPSMDYFLSSALMEPPGAERLYSERLIRLPNLGTGYEAQEWPAFRPHREALGLRPKATVYWSGQALYKYLPQYDEVFPRIARSVEDGQFVFIEFARDRTVTDLFRSRLERAFGAFGLRASDHCVFLRPMPQDAFLGAVCQCDVLLDTIGWSGGKSTLDSLVHDAPIVTLPGRFLRGRHTAAILRHMRVSDTIADSIDDYIAIAVRLALDTEFRASVRAKMAANRHRASGDLAYMTALETFLGHAVR